MAARKSIVRAARREANQPPPTREQITGATRDSFANFVAKIGVGTDNQSSFGTYGFNPISRIRVLLDFAYRGSWICRMAVGIPAHDMTKGGIELGSDLDPTHMDLLYKAYNKKFRIAQKLKEAIEWARLYGGSIAVMLIDGQKASDPFRPDTISKGQFCGLAVCDRWMLTPSLEDLVTDIRSPNLGKPKYYTVISNAPVLARQKIHHTRCFRFDGEDLPYYQSMSENLWGLSVLEPIFDRIMAFDATTQGMSQLVYGARLRTLSISKLRGILAGGGKLRDALFEQVDWMRRFQTNEGITLLDSDDKFESMQYTFTGLDAVLLQMGQQMSGALQMPMVRLFGQSPAGLNSTGESDLRTYYDGIDEKREDDVRPPLEILIPVIARSEGIQLPNNFTFGFRSLWQLKDQEKSDMAEKDTQTISSAFAGGMVTRFVALKELKQSSKKTGIWTNITDEDLRDAEQEPPLLQQGQGGEEGMPLGAEGFLPGGGPSQKSPGSAAEAGEDDGKGFLPGKPSPRVQEARAAVQGSGTKPPPARTGTKQVIHLHAANDKKDD